jgi:SOS response regulatory protein OraA/RecX
MQRAVRLLSRRPYSCEEMRLKLAPYAGDQEIDAVLNRLVELSLLNDEEYAYNFALCQTRQQGWGPLKVFHSLLRKRVPAKLAELTIDRIRRETSDEVVLREYVGRYFRKSGIPQDRKGIHKLIAHLRRRGYLDETIFMTLRGTIPPSAWRTFETGD